MSRSVKTFRFRGRFLSSSDFSRMARPVPPKLLAMSPLPLTPSFTRAIGSTLDVVGVGDNRIGTEQTIKHAEAMLKDTENYPFIGDVIDQLKIGEPLSTDISQQIASNSSEMSTKQTFRQAKTYVASRTFMQTDPTLAVVFTDPVSGTIEWSAVERLLIAAGAQVIEGRGSRVRFEKDGEVETFHRPHPAKKAKRYQVRAARAFLERIGVTP